MVSYYRNTDQNCVTAKRSVNSLIFMLRWIVIVTALMMLQKMNNEQQKVENEVFPRLLNRRCTLETWMVIMKGSTICRELARAVEITSLRSFALVHEK